ncbi:30S ribosomal protein S14 [Candidatus Pacearchaeota archaeon CG10_big_fil_rev_8_21_14_0_10_35_13]|nr:MAG: 30S ribosomal protein S14 [Candidatus Pacearchaeota archaeon CG10_big_fil_rev_8_21_14_0_10_35_13]
MGASSWKKTLKQLRNKPVVRAKYEKHNKPKERKFGAAVRRCEVCERIGGHISSYGLHLCRHCFRETAEKIGFKKYQ